MISRRPGRLIPWALLIIVGCSGSSNGNLGCGSSCITPIVGGFPASERQSEAASIKISEKGLRFAESQVANIIQSVGASTGGLSFSIPCTQQTPSIITGVNAQITACDLDGDAQCTAYDDDQWNRYDYPVSKCAAQATVTGSHFTPTQDPDGTVHVKFELQIEVQTGEIPITVGLSTVLGNACGLDCSASYDSTIKMPAYVPITSTIDLTIDGTRGDILTFDVGGIDDITKSLDTSELQINSNSGGCSLGFLNVTCDVLNNDIVKQLIFSQLQGQVNDRIRDTIDGARCVQCESGTHRCPGASTCEQGLGLCYYDYSQRTCPTIQLGLEGRARIGDQLASFGGDPNAQIDIYAVAGGKTNDMPSNRVQNGGLQVGMMGGARAPVPSQCIRNPTWTPRDQPAQVDFDAEVAAQGPGSNLSDYQVGIALSDNFLDKAFFSAWAAGALCLNISSDQVSMLTSGLVSSIVPGLNVVTHGQDVPMLLALRPTTAPDVKIGRGLSGAADSEHLLTLNMKDTDLDFYAFVEERYVRLFTTRVDISLPLDLDFDPIAGTITPVIGDLSMAVGKVTALNNEMKIAKDEDIAALIPTLIGAAGGALGGAIPPFALPAVLNYNLSILGARGTVPGAVGGGYQHLALFAEMEEGQPQFTRTDTAANLVESYVPATPVDLTSAASQPKAVIEMRGLGSQSLNFPGYEYSARIDGGFWSSWTQSSRMEIAAPVLRLEGRHNIDVRSRVLGHQGTADLEPARVVFTVDYVGPSVQLVEGETHEVATIAHDTVSTDAELGFRYRVAGGDWTAWGAMQTFATSSLGAEPSLEVEVRDAAGHATRAIYGTPADQLNATVHLPKKPASKLPASSAGGCTQTGAGMGAAMFALSMLLSRRRSRR